MGLDYTFTLRASAKTSAATLQAFLQSVEADAQAMGFQPTFVFTATFDTQEQRDFARRIGVLVPITHENLQGVVLPRKEQVLNFDPVEGRCRVLPESAVALVVTDERHTESVFAFARYPETIDDIHGKPLVKMPFGKRWHFNGIIQSPDPRYRRLMKRFADADYVEAERDEYYPASK